MSTVKNAGYILQEISYRLNNLSTVFVGIFKPPVPVPIKILKNKKEAASNYKITWSGKDSIGNKAPPGEYQVILTVISDEGEGGTMKKRLLIEK